jgi:hypothetical protein
MSRAWLTRIGCAALTAPLLLAACGGSAADIDCEGVSIDAVRQAAADVAGYTFDVAGADTSGTLLLDRDAPEPYTYQKADFAARGGYLAPDRGLVEVTEGLLMGPGRSSSALAGWEWDAEEYVRVGEAAWMRTAADPEHFVVLDRRVLATVPNMLGPLLGGIAFGMELVDEPWTGSSDVRLTWTAATATSEGCALVGTLPLPSPLAEEGRFELRVVAYPVTLLPATVDFEVRVPGDVTRPTTAFDLSYAFDYERLPAIESPAELVPGASEEPATPGWGSARASSTSRFSVVPSALSGMTATWSAPAAT